MSTSLWFGKFSYFDEGENYYAFGLNGLPSLSLVGYGQGYR
jgi:hypothetical protein